MKVKKLFALVLSVAMILSLAACGTTETPAATEAPAAPATEAPVETEPAKVEVSVDFEDGNMGFVALYDGMANADASTLEIVDFNGGKGLKVTNGSGKVPYVAFDVASLLGENAANVASIQMTMGIENPDGEFYACSGEVKLWAEKELSKTAYGWSVYLENKNPKVATVVLEDEAFSADVAPLMVVNLNTDNGATAGKANANFFIDDIRFLDASGNLIAADTSAVFAAPNGFSGEKDMSNLQYLGANAVALEGMSGKAAGAWAQDGVEMTPEFLEALVPGSVIEIEYASETGDMWIVMPWAEAGWMRVQQQTAATNLSKNIAQITYEQIAAVCGEDKATWGAMLQCEASGAWEVYSVKVGMPTGLKNLANKVNLDGFAVTGDAWAQNGIELTPEQQALLVPGAVIEINYTSETGDMWLVMPWAEVGWSRIEQQTAPCNGSVCQITYEQIAAVCGDDVSKWGTMMQCESSGAWEVFAVSISSGSFINTTGNVNLDGFAVTGDAWAQNGIELTPEQQALLVPGAVITIQYASETGDMWLVMPWATAGWSRIQQQTAACDGSVCQITYEQIAAVCGDNVADWGTMMQCEASGAWEVFSVSIGMAAE